MNFNNYNYAWLNEHPQYSLGEQLKHIRIPDLSELDEAIKKDKKLKKILTTPLYKLPPNILEYSHKYFSNLPMVSTLYNAIKFCLEDFFTQGEFYYSEDGATIKGFLLYTLKGNAVKGITPYIWDIGIVSFDFNEDSTTLLRDTINLFKDLRKKYKEISWSIDKNNSAVEMYKELSSTYQGYFKEDPIDPTCFRFYIEGDLK